MGRGIKITWLWNSKIDIYVFLFVDFRLFFILNIHFSSWPFHNSPIFGKIGDASPPPYGGSLHGQGRHCLPFQNENRVCTRWFLQCGLGNLMGSRVGYQMCGCFPCQRTLISVPLSWILKTAGPTQGIRSF